MNFFFSTFFGHNKIVKTKMSKIFMFFFFFFSFLVLESLAIERVSIVESIIMSEDMIKMAGYGEEKLSTVFIHGKVVCDNNSGCNNNNIKDEISELGPRPIPGLCFSLFNNLFFYKYNYSVGASLHAPCIISHSRGGGSVWFTGSDEPNSFYLDPILY